MLVLLSPAKSLDYDSQFKCNRHSTPVFTKEIAILSTALKDLTAPDLKKLMGISDKLAELNHNRFQKFTSKFNASNSRQALLAFNGDVYNNIEKTSYNEQDFDFAQDHLRILSGFYGILKPLDLMQPYRLEMGTDFRKISTNNKQDNALIDQIQAINLYKFWGDKISHYLNNEIKSSHHQNIINLASNEYFSAIDPKSLLPKVINIAFKEKKGGVLKIIGISAKKARGLMANFIIKNKITNPAELKNFTEGHYLFDKELSNDSNFIFTR